MDVLKEYKVSSNLAIFKTLGGIILPFIAGVIALAVGRKIADIMVFIDRGDFLIYSTALFSTSFFLYTENSKSIGSTLDRWISVSLLYILIICSIIYGGCFLLTSLELNEKINITFLRISSFLLFGASVYTLIRSIKLDFKKIYPIIDVSDQSKVDVEILVKEMERK